MRMPAHRIESRERPLHRLVASRRAGKRPPCEKQYRSLGFAFIAVGIAIGVTTTWIAGVLMGLAGVLFLVTSRRPLAAAPEP